jgi:hypothetical protein
MFPLLALAAQLLPEFVPDLYKKLGLEPTASPENRVSALNEQSGAFQAQVTEAFQKALNTANTTTADPAAAQAAITANNAAHEQLKDDLAAIFDLELKERDRVRDESQRVQLEMYQLEAEERDRERAAGARLPPGVCAPKRRRHREEPAGRPGDPEEHRRPYGLRIATLRSR